MTTCESSELRPTTFTTHLLASVLVWALALALMVGASTTTTPTADQFSPPVVAEASDHPPETTIYVGTGDELVDVLTLVEAVRESAAEVDGATPGRDIELRFVELVPDHKLGRMGMALGDVAYVRHDRDSGRWVETTLHELAHVLTPDGHGPVWQSVYVGAVERVLGPEAAERERVGIAGRYGDEGSPHH